MANQRGSNTGKNRRSAPKQQLSSARENNIKATNGMVAPPRKSKRGVKKTVQNHLKESHTFQENTHSSGPNNVHGCLGCSKLKAKVERLQEELNKLREKNKPVKSESPADLLMEKVKALESKVDSMCETTKMSALCAMELENGDIGNSGVKVEIRDDKINLGQNIFCSIANWKVMNVTDTMPEWYVAILRGTFGKDAMNYRVNPRSKENKAFDPVFLQVAKAHFTIFLDRRVSELKNKEDAFSQHLSDFFQTNREKLIKQLPASLSDRAYEMYRGKLQLPRKRSAKSEERSTRSFTKMVTQPKLKKGLELLYKASVLSEGSEEEEFK